MVKNNHLFRNISIYLIMLVVVAMGLKMTMPQDTKPAEWTYSSFTERLAAGEIKSVTLKSVGEDNYKIEGETKKGDKFTLYAPASDQTLHNQLQEKGVTVKYQPSEGAPWWAGLFSTLLPVLLIGGFLFFYAAADPGERQQGNAV